MSEILFVSKPFAPPWNDGSKTLVRDVSGALSRHTPVRLGVRGVPVPVARGRVEPTFLRPSEGFGLGALPGMRLATRLASGPRGDLWHFVAAPTALAGRTARALAKVRRVPTVQTVASLPQRDQALHAALFADRVVVLSRRTEARFLEQGVPRSSLRRIPPCVAPCRAPEGGRLGARRRTALPSDAPVLVFPGDLERERGAGITLEAFARLPRTLGAILVVAARRKSMRSADAERVLRARAMELGVADHVRWLGETAQMHELLGAADVVVLPAIDLTAKVDIPIVLLEAVSLGTPVVVARGSSADELADGDGALAVSPDPAALAEALRGVVDDTARRHALGRAAMAGFERYRPERVAAAYEAVYDEVLS